MKIRKATIKDVKIISNIEYESGYKWNTNKKQTFEMINKLFHERYCEIYILKNKNKPIGYFAISFDKKKNLCYLNYFAIKKKEQGKSFSNDLMNYAILVANRNKVKAIKLTVWAKNFPAIALYNKFGFYVLDIKKKYYNNGDDKLIMKKLLR